MPFSVGHWQPYKNNSMWILCTFSNSEKVTDYLSALKHNCLLE